MKDVSAKFRSSKKYTLEIGHGFQIFFFKEIIVYPSTFHEYDLISLGPRRLLGEN